MDADDFLAPDKIASQLAVLPATASRKILLSSAWCRFYYRFYRAPFIPNSLWTDLAPVEWMIRKMENNDWMAIESWLISRELTDAAGRWDISLLRDNDGDYVSRVVCASEGIRFAGNARSYIRRGNRATVSSDFNLSGRKVDSIFKSITQQIGYLRALDDSARARRACAGYLQRWLHYFYPERPDLVSQLEELVLSLGGHSELPEVSWKVACIQKCFGWKTARHLQSSMRRYRQAMARAWDKTMFRLERRSGSLF